LAAASGAMGWSISCVGLDCGVLLLSFICAFTTFQCLLSCSSVASSSEEVLSCSVKW
jgi:hypothetical protein